MLIGCICDLDGTLLDTEPLYLAAYSSLAERWGKVYDWNVRQHVVGRAELAGAATIVEMLNLPVTPEQLLEERDKILEELFPTAPPLPGAIKIAKYMKEQLGLKTAIATSSNTKYLALKRKNNEELFKYFDVVICGDDPRVKRGKPHPDIFLVAAESIGIDPKECIAFEDTVAGVDAATAAGMTVIAIPDPNFAPKCAHATKVLTSLDNFDPVPLGLPPIKTE